MGRMGGLAKAARHDPAEGTRAARAAFDQKFLDEVDPDKTLPPEERTRRAKALRRLHFLKMAWRSAESRRKRVSRREARKQRRRHYDFC